MNEKEIHLRDYLRIISKRKGTIFTFFILTLLIVIIATFTATPLYFASTKVMIERNTAGALTSSYRYTPYDPEFIETNNQLITSSAVLEKAVKSLNPEKIYDTFFAKKEEKKSYISYFTGWTKDQYISFKELIGIEKLASESIDNDIVEKSIPDKPDITLSKAKILEGIIKNNISVSPVENSRILQIGYMSDNPAVSAQIANSVAQAYIDELVDMQMEVSGYSIGWMKKKSEIQRINLEESEKELYEYKKKHDIVMVEDKITVLPERLSDLSRNLTVAETKRQELLAIYNQVKNIRKGQLETITVIAEAPSIKSINLQIQIIQQKISELSKKYGPKHPRMSTAKNELTTLKNAKYQELGKIVQTIKNEYLLAQSNERDLKELLAQTRFDAARFGEKSIQLGILQRKVDTNRYLYDALVKKMKESGITERSQAVNVWVIEKAQLPEYPAKPRKKRNILLGIILGLFGGLGLAFFLEYLDNTVKTPEDVEEKFDIPVISTIDFLKDKEQTIIQNVLNDSSSLIAESFEGLRTSIMLSSGDNPLKTILISSIIPGEGKSSISACLAITTAQSGKKVLLIDADMRRPVQHKNLNLENTSGLSSFLAGVSDAKGLELNSPIENLDVITAGPIPPNPSELLDSKKFVSLLSDASEIYDRIIIDTPPLASVTDPIILSQHVDGFIIVTWAGKTTYEMLGNGLKKLKEADAPITGLVLNRFSAKKSGYYYNYGDYYYASDS
ncbi:MAG: polysaccharide biosynthesis tyrosine autokinase [Desulfobacula sp.]|nr:polysaccharide biosynthesis tyrosine autokinase [Desulfobacula sp.]MBT3806661.1 polysaccharide biosynthesis tyrosine autokinase [Desulfobacula sp.]MBT4505949.1 polysaccharide biosynthesis tyrosine autokinase [Desulfobacula sp.]MBT5971019.1 polysaccharide biosynthesis tyrosine autokinase [Desulfobacula sp.]MBT6339191.1 polysaccharide biosynthesis tyrosine autokinase [Desulfobacula sp.]